MLSRRLLSANTQKIKYQPLPENDSNSIALQDISQDSYSAEVDSIEDIKLKAMPPGSVKISSPFHYLDFVPYQLQASKPGLFPEFYYQFKKSFSALSQENKVYCLKSLEDFKSSFIGEEKQIVASVDQVEDNFEQKFRCCLDSQLIEEYAEWSLNRSCVEEQFRDKLAEVNDLTSYIDRRTELMQNICDDTTSFVEFLVAYDFSESTIWEDVLSAFGVYFSTAERRKFMISRAEAWKSSSVSIISQTEGFAKDLRKKGFHEDNARRNSLLVSFAIIFVCVFTVATMIVIG